MTVFRIDRYSASSVPLTIKGNGNVIGKATGFFWRFRQQLYLATNWHVLSGRDPRTGQARHEGSAIPDLIEFPVLHAGQLDAFDLVGAPLEDEKGGALWLQHPDLGQHADVALRPLFPESQYDYHALPHSDEAVDMDVRPGTTVFVLGFPLGLTMQGQLPIWKQATVASEPDLPVDGKQMFLIDTATREGMSGAPVIARSFGTYQRKEGGSVHHEKVANSFLGVYAGRYLGENESEAQIGRVWYASLLEDVATGKTKGTFEIPD